VAERQTTAAHLKWPLRISEDRHQGVLILTLAGRIGSISAPTLRDRLDAISAGGDRRLVLDCGGVDYLSSAGLVVLEAANSRFDALKGALVLCALTEPVRIVLDLAGATARFAIEPSRDLGVARLAGG
jgi:anti-anti-sigma factor